MSGLHLLDFVGPRLGGRRARRGTHLHGAKEFGEEAGYQLSLLQPSAGVATLAPRSWSWVGRGAKYEVHEQASEATGSASASRALPVEALALLDVGDAPAMTAFFRPEGIALIGATADESKLGFGVVRNLLEGGYPGSVHLVGTKEGTLFSRPMYASVTEVPDPVDLAVILIPAPAVPPVLDACGRRGIRAVVISSGGFREVGTEGAALERQCLEIAARYRMRLLGPNCIGTIDTHVPLDTTFLPPPPPPSGNVAFVSQSGAICAAMIDWTRGQGFGFSRLVSLGNEADISETDMLDAFAEDPETKVIAMYLEGIVDGRRFVDVARTVDKPFIAFKVGRFDAGRKAASSHTGALAGEDVAYEAAFRRAGILRATSTEEMFDWARAFSNLPLPAGPGVAVLTNAGGPGVAASDAIEQYGMRMASLSSDTITLLEHLLPSAASANNPVDMLASASPEIYARSLEVLLEDTAVDAVMVILPPPPRYAAQDVVEALIPVIDEGSKPVVVALMGGGLIDEAANRLRAAKVPEYRFPSRAAGALGALYRHAVALDLDQSVCAIPESVDAAAAARVLAHSSGWLDPSSVTALMTAYGIPTAPSVRAENAALAAAAAEQIGYPVVVKLDSPDLPHKSDVGGVLLGLSDADGVRIGVETMLTKVRNARPGARIDGVVIQEMITDGQEVAIGVVRDPQFGPLVMYGSGGVDVESMGDVAFALAPVTCTDVDYLLGHTWAGRRLGGSRGQTRVDRDAVIDVMIRLGAMAVAHSEIAEVEINPLLARADGTVALDARVRVDACEA
ncbi:MAG: CoA-binding protein [Gammaproteobacteria bacterium]|nr:CoA-binding protein [Gammaproteobacteria bacterium]